METGLDDVLTEVWFEPVPGGTRVVGEHTEPPGDRDRAAAMHWLNAVLGLGSVEDLPVEDDPLAGGDHEHPWLGFRTGTLSLMIGHLDEERATGAQVFEPLVYVDDLAAHFAHSKGNGARCRHTRPRALLAGRPRRPPAIDAQRKRVGDDEDANAPGEGDPEVVARRALCQE